MVLVLTQCAFSTPFLVAQYRKSPFTSSVSLGQSLTLRLSCTVWLQYAAFEEIDTEDYERARDVYKAAVKLVPHKQFTFAKLWAAYAAFEVRRLDVVTARKIFGAAIGMCPKPKLFVKYIEMEIQLREFDRCRTLYQKFLEVSRSTVRQTIRSSSLTDVIRLTVRPITRPSLDPVDRTRDFIGRCRPCPRYLRAGCAAGSRHARAGLEGEPRAESSSQSNPDSV